MANSVWVRVHDDDVYSEAYETELAAKTAVESYLQHFVDEGLLPPFDRVYSERDDDIRQWVYKISGAAHNALIPRIIRLIRVEVVSE